MATKKLRPVHPGDILLHDFMQPLTLSSYRAAKELGVAAPWQNLQTQYDLEIANKRIGKKVERAIQPLTRPDLTDRSTSS